MPFDVFIQAVQLAKRAGAKSILISGGEPTDHPLYFEFINYLKFNYEGGVVVISHGAYIDDREKREAVFGQYKDVLFQITNDKRYYPKTLDRSMAMRLEVQYPNVTFIWKIGGELFPQGRALRHMKVTSENAKTKGTRCFNLRSMVNHPSIGNFSAAIAMLESQGRFCTPSININGSISMGESNECPETAYVDTSLDGITVAIKSSQCNDCGMLDKLSPFHHAAIGYHG